MRVLHRIFEKLAEPGIIGPHGESPTETELLLAGVKPVGLIALVDAPFGKGIKVQKTCLENIHRLDEAVASGRLVKKTIRAENFWGEGSNGVTAHFFAQPSKQDDLNEVLKFHETYWLKGDFQKAVSDIKHDIGHYYGYTEKDIELFRNGWNSISNPVERWIMQRTNSLRRYCRVKTMLDHASLD